MNNLSLSEPKLKGSLFLQCQWLKTRRAVSSAVALIVVGIMHTSDPRQLVMERMQWYPLSVGIGLMKSSAKLLPCLSSIGSGCKGPGGLVV